MVFVLVAGIPSRVPNMGPVLPRINVVYVWVLGPTTSPN